MKKILFPEMSLIKFIRCGLSVLHHGAIQAAYESTASLVPLAGTALNSKLRQQNSVNGWQISYTKEGIMKTLMEGLAGGSVISYKDNLTKIEHMAATEYVLSLGT